MPRHRVAGFITALCMAAAGYGVVLVPQSMKAFAPANVAFRSVDGYDEEVELALAYRAHERAPCVKEFVECAVSRLSCSGA